MPFVEFSIPSLIIWYYEKRVSKIPHYELHRI